jgi:hypothetical protein
VLSMLSVELVPAAAAAGGDLVRLGLRQSCPSDDSFIPESGRVKDGKLSQDSGTGFDESPISQRVVFILELGPIASSCSAI